MAGADDTTIYNHLRRMLCAGALSGAPDEELLEQFVARRDEAAFAVLLRRHGPMVWGVCRRLLTHSEDAEDVINLAEQEIFALSENRLGEGFSDIPTSSATPSARSMRFTLAVRKSPASAPITTCSTRSPAACKSPT